MRTDFSDGDSDKEANLYVLKNTSCPAVLTENLFMDNKKDVEFLLSDKGFHSIVRLHVEGILNYIKDNS
jgi:N-acetylmuramoyl-L-alanine amidase